MKKSKQVDGIDIQNITPESIAATEVEQTIESQDSLPKSMQSKQLMPRPDIEIDLTYREKFKNCVVNRSTRCKICRDQQVFDLVNSLGSSGYSYNKIINHVTPLFPDLHLNVTNLAMHFKHHFVVNEYRKELMKLNPESQISMNFELQDIPNSAMQILLRNSEKEATFLQQQKGLLALQVHMLNDMLEHKDRIEHQMYDNGDSMDAPPPDMTTKEWYAILDRINNIQELISKTTIEIDKKMGDGSRIDIRRIENMAIKLAETMDEFFDSQETNDKDKNILKQKISNLFNELTS